MKVCTKYNTVHVGEVLFDVDARSGLVGVDGCDDEAEVEAAARQVAKHARVLRQKLQELDYNLRNLQDQRAQLCAEILLCEAVGNEDE